MGNQSIFEKLKIPNIIITIIIIIIAVMIYNRQLESIAALKKKVVVEEDKNKILKDLADLKKRVDAYLNLLARKEVRVFMNSVQTFAKDSGVTINSIKPKSEQLKTGYIVLPFDLEATAPNYHALAKFINKIENSRDVFFVDSSNIASAGKEDNLKVNLTVSSIIFENTEK